MLDAISKLISKLIPIFGTFGCGIILRRIGVFGKSDAQTLLSLVFYIAVPAIIFDTLLTHPVSSSMAVLPFCALIASLATLFLGWVARPREETTRGQLGSYLLATMIINTSFVLPFVMSLLSPKDLTTLILFDVGNAIAIFVLAYGLACYFGHDNPDPKVVVRQILCSPPLWAVFAGLTSSTFSLSLPAPLDAFVKALSGLTGPLVMIALGILFRPTRDSLPLVAQAVGIRVAGGFLTGAIVGTIAGFDNKTWVVAAVCAGAPCGYNTVTFSSLFNLDSEFATSAVSLSIVAGLILVPMVLFLVP